MIDSKKNHHQENATLVTNTVNANNNNSKETLKLKKLIQLELVIPEVITVFRCIWK